MSFPPCILLHCNLYRRNSKDCKEIPGFFTLIIFSLSFLSEVNLICILENPWRQLTQTAHWAWSSHPSLSKSLDMTEKADGRWDQTERGNQSPKTQLVGASVVLLSRRHRLKTGRIAPRQPLEGLINFSHPVTHQARTSWHLFQEEGVTVGIRGRGILRVCQIVRPDNRTSIWPHLAPLPHPLEIDDNTQSSNLQTDY